MLANARQHTAQLATVSLFNWLLLNFSIHRKLERATSAPKHNGVSSQVFAAIRASWLVEPIRYIALMQRKPSETSCRGFL